jgi:hypothetical protein
LRQDDLAGVGTLSTILRSLLSWTFRRDWWKTYAWILWDVGVSSVWCETYESAAATQQGRRKMRPAVGYRAFALGRTCGQTRL